ncbi:D-lactate dehydrogenase [Nocardia seriolae]|uniref:D-lactate dehydrogenase n=1 Tax=Nocardia seriolae TaxID=37332 RepID=A0ABC9YWT9_9NOCA|nr:hypothetical protein NSERKGN1266_13120 [Nocardia seriolae]BEK98803.1 hypothetical protein NSER024013_67090 [Nocardia seriolae]GAM47911.1 D-lactate dehydrogenase [Nocardia seriolae]GAP29731.1 D-lactate dehydrogenase [Nocardia seriolae]GEM28369.1 hypothetical protein NS2_66080 [Nocardia seriolae NBRC 15557]
MEESVKVVAGSVNEQVLARFPRRSGSTLMNHAANACGIVTDTYCDVVHGRLVRVMMAARFRQALDRLAKGVRPAVRLPWSDAPCSVGVWSVSVLEHPRIDCGTSVSCG